MPEFDDYVVTGSDNVCYFGKAGFVGVGACRSAGDGIVNNRYALERVCEVLSPALWALVAVSAGSKTAVYYLVFVLHHRREPSLSLQRGRL
jgi:hypothetical protein